MKKKAKNLSDLFDKENAWTDAKAFQLTIKSCANLGQKSNFQNTCIVPNLFQCFQRFLSFKENLYIQRMHDKQSHQADVLNKKHLFY